MPPTTHSKLSPSSAHQWTTCTAAPGYMEHNPDKCRKDTGSVHADMGTRAHDIAEQILTGGLTEKDIPAEFSHVRIYTDHCKTLRNRWNGTEMIETKVPLFYRPTETGTCDFALVCPNRLIIRDYKNGVQSVDAEDNLQMMIYAQSFIEDPEVSICYEFPDDMIVDIGIIQPNDRAGEPEKLWETTVKALREQCAPIRPIADTIEGSMKSKAVWNAYVRGSSLKFEPSEKACQYCRIRQHCAERLKLDAQPLFPETDVLAAFDTVEEITLSVLPNTVTEMPMPVLSERQILAIFANKGRITKLLADVESYCQQMAAAGTPVPGTKLVEGKPGNRAWADENAAENCIAGMSLAIDPWEPRKLQSYSKITKALKEKGLKPKDMKALDEFVVRPAGKPTLVLESDSRPAIAAAADAFADIENHEEDPV